MDPAAADASRRHDDRGEHDEAGSDEEEQQHITRPRELPADLPRSLDDRKSYSYEPPQETEYYDAWQGVCAHSPSML